MVFLIIAHVRWCPAETCKINLMVQYISCLLCSEAEIPFFLENLRTFLFCLSNGLKITIEANKKTIKFLDVTLDLTSGSFKPFMKPNNKILYVHRQSNHPPTLLKNIPQNTNKRLTSISSNQKVFNDAIPPYQKALDKSGYDYKLTYNPQSKRNRNRQRKTIWYNPSWNANVKTNLGRKFLNIIDRCFPNEHPLHKIFNQHTLKLSYSCMPNMKSFISSHNKAVLSDYHQSQTQTSDKECNLQKKGSMPAGRKMPHKKCSLPSHSHNTNIIRLIRGPRHKFQRAL